jgi:hypothetical protein
MECEEMRSRLHRYATPLHASEYPLHCRGGRQFVLQNDFSCFIRDAVRTEAISQIQPNAQLLLENAEFFCRETGNVHCI